MYKALYLGMDDPVYRSGLALSPGELNWTVSRSVFQPQLYNSSLCPINIAGTNLICRVYLEVEALFDNLHKYYNATKKLTASLS